MWFLTVPFLIAVPLLDFNVFNPPPYWPVIQSVKQLLSCAKCSQATVENPFQLLLLLQSNLMSKWSHTFPYRILGVGGWCALPMSPICRCYHAVMSSILWVRCILDTGAVSKFILFLKSGVRPPDRNYHPMSFCLIANQIPSFLLRSPRQIESTIPLSPRGNVNCFVFFWALSFFVALAFWGDFLFLF